MHQHNRFVASFGESRLQVAAFAVSTFRDAASNVAFRGLGADCGAGADLTFPLRAAGGDHPQRCLNTAPQLRKGAMLTLARSCGPSSSAMPRETRKRPLQDASRLLAASLTVVKKRGLWRAAAAKKHPTTFPEVIGCVNRCQVKGGTPC
jgi:hypothetical protein